MAKPIITLLTDFGLQDGYVASMKGVILSIAPDVQTVDISHLVPAQDIRSAAFILFSCYRFFPTGTIHVAVVDPAVGTERRPLAIRTTSCILVGPDNGIFSFVMTQESPLEARILQNPHLMRTPVSMTFHGRDIFSSVAAHLASDTPFETLGRLCTPIVSPWTTPLESPAGIQGEVIHIDRFGNAVTNVTRDLLAGRAPIESWTVLIDEGVRLPILDTYARTQAGNALALTGSSGFIEIAVNQGSAASQLGLQTGSKISFRLPPS